MIGLVLSLLLQPTGPAAAPDGTRLHPGSRCYEIVAGDKVIGQTWQRVQAATDAGLPVWDIVVHQRMTNGKFDLRDHFVLRRSDLRPLRMDSRKDGVEHVRVRYTADGIETAFAGKPPVTIAAPGPLWDGNLWGLTFAALPLAEGAHFDLPYYQYDKGLGRFALDVVGSEQGDGHRAWIVEADAGDGRKVRYRIGQDPADELGYASGGFGQRPGGDCAALAE